MKAYGGVDVYIRVFLTSKLVELSVSRPGCFTPGTHWTGDCVDPKAGFNDMEM
jgi:hypothetical protein